LGQTTGYLGAEGDFLHPDGRLFPVFMPVCYGRYNCIKIF
jgi:hypothetical protein